ncbi:MAG: lyase HEAT-like repeat protein [Planctomycetota bacterium]|nr:lyase HEAT-like repeat protein [Planctomycetota bacterium]
MKHGMRKSISLAIFGLVAASSLAGAQVVNRDVKVTGPKGRSIERQIHTERGPGYAERDITIRRPGGTYERDVRVQRGGGHVPGPGPRGPNVYQRNVVIENDYYLPPPRPALFGFGFGGPSFNFGFASPPPVYVAPPPIFVEPAPPPTVIYQPPIRYAAPPAQTVVADPVAAAMDRLKSYHNHSRRDGALTLGRLGDARAVPALIDRLDRDGEKEVRVAAAWALGEIGDPRGALSLQKASLYDRKREVKEAAAIAYQKLDRAPINDPNVRVPEPDSTSPTPLPLPDEEPPSRSRRSLDPPPPPMPDQPR